MLRSRLRSWLRVAAKPFHRSPWAHARGVLCPLIPRDLILPLPRCPSPSLVPLSLSVPPFPSQFGCLSLPVPLALVKLFPPSGTLFPEQPRPALPLLPFQDPTCAARSSGSSGPAPPCGAVSPESLLPQATTRSSSFPWEPPASTLRRWLPAGTSWVRMIWVQGSWGL